MSALGLVLFQICLFLILLQNSVHFISISLAFVRSLLRSSQHQTQPEFRENFRKYDTTHLSAGEFCIDRMDYWRRGKVWDDRIEMEQAHVSDKSVGERGRSIIPQIMNHRARSRSKGSGRHQTQ